MPKPSLPISNPDPTLDPYGDKSLRRLQLFIYLLPVLGSFPAMWTLYTRSGDRQQERISRLSIVLTLLWLFGTLSFSASSQHSETLFLPFLLVNSLWTSGYFLICLGLMTRLWQNLPLLPTTRRKIN